MLGPIFLIGSPKHFVVLVDLLLNRAGLGELEVGPQVPLTTHLRLGYYSRIEAHLRRTGHQTVAVDIFKRDSAF